MHFDSILVVSIICCYFYIFSYFYHAYAWFFSISVTLLTLATVCWVERLFAVQNSFEIIGFSLLFAISLMALLEHWFMVLPIPDARLWRWMLPKTKSKQDYLSEDYNGL